MAAVPILLVAGALGAGKTTLINRLLNEAQGRRIAAIVNDFGAIDIDAALLGASADGIVSLKNGCICCSLQGDLLRALSTVLRREPDLDAIVIETSGVSDPAEIVRNLLDPVVFKAAALDAVLCLVDADQLASTPGLADDALWLSQLRSADFVLLTKADLLDDAGTALVRQRIDRLAPRKPVFDAGGALDTAVLFGATLHAPGAASPPRPVAAPAFASTSWTSPAPLSLARFQAVLGRLSQALLRAKGVVVFAEHPAQPMLVQLVGQRVTVTPSPVPPADGVQAMLVLIGRESEADLGALSALLDGTRSDRSS